MLKSKITIMIAYTLAYIVLMSLFAEPTKQKKIEAIESQYIDDVNAEYLRLTEEYGIEKSIYEQELEEYNKNLIIYEDYIENEWNELKTQSAIDYQEALITYEKELEAYQKSIENRKIAYEKEVDRLKSQALREGQEFKVSGAGSVWDRNSVGNEWSYQEYVNGSEAYGVFVFKLGETISFYSVTREDDKIPDVGSNTTYHKMTIDDFKEGFVIEQDVYVRENAGRYSGNVAQVHFTYTITPNFNYSDIKVEVDESSLPAILEKPTEPKYVEPQKRILEPTLKVNEPTVPTRSDVKIEEPDTSNVEIVLSDLGKYNKTPVTISSLAMFVVYYLLDKFKLTDVWIKKLDKYFGKKELEKAEEFIDKTFDIPELRQKENKLLSVFKNASSKKKKAKKQSSKKRKKR